MLTKLIPRLRWRQALRITCFAFISVVILPLLLIALGLGTEIGRVGLARIAIEQINQATELTIEIKDMSAPKLGHWQAKQVVIKHHQALWFDIQQLNLRWQPAALFKKSIKVESLGADSVSLHNISFPQDDSQSQASANIYLPHIQLNSFYIGQLYLIDFIKDEERQLSYRLAGQAAWLQNQPLSLAFSAQSLTDIPLRLNITSQTLDLKTVALEGTLQEAPGGAIGQLLQLPITEKISARFAAHLSTQDNQLRLDINKLTFPLVDRLIDLNTEIIVDKENLSLHVKHLNLNIDGQQQQLTGSFINQQLNLELTLNRFPVGLLSPWIEDLGEGEISATAHITGPLSDPTAIAQMEGLLEYGEVPASIKFTGSVNKTGIYFNQLDAALLSAKITAKGKLDWTGSSTRLNATVYTFDLINLQRLGIDIPQGLQANILNARATLYGSLKQLQGSVDFVSKGQYQQHVFQLQGELTKILDTITINKGIAKALDGTVKLDGTVNAISMNSKLNIGISEIPLSVVELAGISLPNDLVAKLNADLSLTGQLQNPKVNAKALLTGKYQDIPVAINANGSYSEASLSIESLMVKAFDEEVLNLSGSYQNHYVDLQATIDQMPSQLFSAIGWQLQHGGLNASLGVKGSLQSPMISGHLSYETVLSSVDFEGENQDQSFTWQLDLTTEKNVLYLLSAVEHANNSPVSLAAQLPIAPYISYFTDPSTSPHTTLFPLEAKIDGSVNLDTLSFLLDPDLHRLSGTITADLSMNGTVQNPKINGAVNIKNARYANSLTGTVIEKIDCTISTSLTRLTTEHCQASDGQTGKYTLRGILELPIIANNGAIDLTLETSHASILRRPDIESEATGEINLKGDFKNLLASGNLEVSPFMALIDSALNNDTPKIEVEEIYAEQTKNITIAEKYSLPVINLDLTISADRQAFLRGRGLEAELKGKITLKGDFHNPHYEGTFRTVRGEFEVFGKKFKLEQGSVSFANNAIAIAIPGIYKKNGQQIRAEIRGSNENFTLSLSAIPAMAQDEILAFIIFGKSLQKITPFEAVQLASAVQKLRSGGASFFDPIGSTRELLGVDTLTIESEKTNNGDYGLNLGIGKYLNEKVYLELERTPNPSQPWKGSLEIELTPNLNLESSTGGETGIEGLELKWKHDY